MNDKIKKPEKKELKEDSWRYGNYKRTQGYNQACDDYEKFLPSEEEILKLLSDVDYRTNTATRDYFIAKAISKRIRGER